MTEELREHSASTNTIHPAQPEASPETDSSMPEADMEALNAALRERLGINRKALGACGLLQKRTDEAVEQTHQLTNGGQKLEGTEDAVVAMMEALMLEVKFLRRLHFHYVGHTCGEHLPEDVLEELADIQTGLQKAGLL